MPTKVFCEIHIKEPIRPVILILITFFFKESYIP